MGTINTKLDNLKEADVWSFILFALFKLRDLSEYSALSELAYVLDKQNLINLCEYFGGLTITIPKIEDLELMIKALLVYQYVEIDKLEYSVAIEKLGYAETARKIKPMFLQIRDLLNNYGFQSRG